MILQVTGAAQSCLTKARVVGEVAADVDEGLLLAIFLFGAVKEMPAKTLMDVIR